MRPPLSCLCLLLCLCTARAQDGGSDELPAGPAIAYEDAFPAQAGFDRPLFVAFHASDPEHAYVVTQPGFVFVVPRDAAGSDQRAFLDIGKNVFLDNWEEGLLGFAFDPDYEKNGFVYAYWSERIEVREGVMGDGTRVKSNRQSVIARFPTKAGDGGRVADAAGELRLMEIFQPFGNHNGGTIEFGPDRMLYVALGDGGAANDPYGNAQSKQMLLGKVLRIDVRGATKLHPYAVPEDNPFAKQQGARGEIWCYGMRNPWRITFDRKTGDLWCGDVGQNRVEEVDRLEKGGNYGWNAMEAGEVFTPRRPKAPVPEGVVAPIAWYPHSEGLSITGGYVYRGERIPELRGYYVYGDFMTLRMWACKEDRKGGKHRVVTLPRMTQQPSSFAEEPDGELLVTGFAGKKGRIFRLVPARK
ncbi:MAG TPA: PQQ-dependent sugar dehydrogenase [Planctomycetota bacterium]|nr:PQQ-dependent sugar dehydrogenase [Planctomycetota bacterium]